MARSASRTTGREDASDEFFILLAERGHEPLLHGVTGSLRFDLTDGADTERVLLKIDDGDVTVSHRGGRADAVVVADRAVFDAMAAGTVNAMAALLRGTVEVSGAYGLVTAVFRLFPGPPASLRSFRRRQEARAR